MLKCRIEIYYHCFDGRDCILEVTELFVKGGPVMYLLLISSVAVAAIGIERFRFYSYASHESENFLSLLKESFKRQQPDEVLNFCNRENSCVGLVAAQSGVCR